MLGVAKRATKMKVEGPKRRELGEGKWRGCEAVTAILVPHHEKQQRTFKTPQDRYNSTSPTQILWPQSNQFRSFNGMVHGR
jgi:hypothetical protein